MDANIDLFRYFGVRFESKNLRHSSKHSAGQLGMCYQPKQISCSKFHATLSDDPPGMVIFICTVWDDMVADLLLTSWSSGNYYSPGVFVVITTPTKEWSAWQLVGWPRLQSDEHTPTHAFGYSHVVSPLTIVTPRAFWNPSYRETCAMSGPVNPQAVAMTDKLHALRNQVWDNLHDELHELSCTCVDIDAMT